MGRGNGVPWGMDSCESTQSSVQERAPSGCKVSVAQSSFVATSAPGFLAASGWAQALGLWQGEAGPALGAKVGPAQQRLGRGGHISCNKTDPPRCSSGLGFAASYRSPSNILRAFVSCCEHPAEAASDTEPQRQPQQHDHTQQT